MSDQTPTPPEATVPEATWSLEQPTPQELLLFCNGRLMATLKGPLGLVIAAKFYAAKEAFGTASANLYAEGVYDGLTHGLSCKAPETPAA